MSQNWTTFWIAAAATVSVVGVLLWKKNRRSFIKVGAVSKLYFFPVKSLRGIEVNKGKCTKLGFEVNGLLDRSFMVINGDGSIVSMEDCPSLILLTQQLHGKTLTISSPSGEKVDVDIKDYISQDDKIIQCRLYSDLTKAVDCGDEASSFFQSYLGKPDVRLVRHFPDLSRREYQPRGKGKPFERQFRNKNPEFKSAGSAFDPAGFMSIQQKSSWVENGAGLQSLIRLSFQNMVPFHVVSKPSVDDLNSKLQDRKISEHNFRPNILIDGCEPFAEDSWRYIKFNSGALFYHVTLTNRCLITTNDPETGILNVKEPLRTMRKFRIPTEPEVLAKTGGPLPCFGIGCGVLETGDIAVGEDVYAVVGPQPKMREK